MWIYRYITFYVYIKYINIKHFTSQKEWITKLYWESYCVNTSLIFSAYVYYIIFFSYIYNFSYFTRKSILFYFFSNFIYTTGIVATHGLLPHHRSQSWTCGKLILLCQYLLWIRSSHVTYYASCFICHRTLFSCCSPTVFLNTFLRICAAGLFHVSLRNAMTDLIKDLRILIWVVLFVNVFFKISQGKVGLYPVSSQFCLHFLLLVLPY